jgi:sulfide:quinone oxidoreductase
MFAVPKYAAALNALRLKRGVAASFNTNLTSLDHTKKVATFSKVGNGEGTDKVEKTFDMMHVVPPQGPLEVLKGSEVGESRRS